MTETELLSGLFCQPDIAKTARGNTIHFKMSIIAERKAEKIRAKKYAVNIIIKLFQFRSYGLN